MTGVRATEHVAVDAGVRASHGRDVPPRAGEALWSERGVDLRDGALRPPHLATARRLAHALNLAVDELSQKVNTMSEERPITAEQALLAVKAAGLDPDKPLSEQLNGPGQLDEKTVKGWVTEAIDQAIGHQGQGGGGESTESTESTDPQSQQQRFAEGYRDALNRSLMPWMGEEEHDDAA
jgi:hypothetical protein